MTAAAPDDAAMRAVADLMRAGRIEDARATVGRALAAGIDSDRLLAIAGMLAWRAGDPAGAIAPLRKLLAHQPDDRATRLNLAAALTETGAFADVETVLAPLAGEFAADRLRAFAAQQTGDQDRALALYRAVLAQRPDDADSWANLGNVHNARDTVDDAIIAFERAITLRPGDARLYLNLAGVLERADRRTARLRVMRDAKIHAPDDPAVLLELGLAEAAEGNLDAAEAALDRAIALRPDAPGPYLELGLLLESRNRIAALDDLAARAEARIGPEAALLSAWAAFRANRFDEAAVLARAVPVTVNPVRRLHLLAQVADRCGDPAEAFGLFEQMNAASLAAAPPLPAGPTYREQVAAATASFRAAPPMPPPLPVDGPPPIFIAGFPRSGTTLLDTMLGALPDTYVLEERPFLAAIEARTGTADPATLNRDEAAALRRYYGEMLRELEPDFTHGRLIDKHPLHGARMPLIHRLFPDAPILFVERHPYDVVLSCFMANFELNLGMRSFATLDEAARTYDAVFAAWTLAEERLPLKVHRVRYERLVEDARNELTQLLAFLDIEADPATLDHRAAAQRRGHISTASYSQVAEPIYHRAVARWRRYADHLKPVIPILAPWAARMGYDVD